MKADSKELKEKLAENGAKGGAATLARHGSAHFAELARKRKHFGGGRPPGSGKKKQK